METLSVRTGKRTEFIDITSKVSSALKKLDIENGLCCVYCPHTTAAVTINENADPSVARDVLYEIDKIVPFDDNYRHTEGNSAAHIKSSMVGASVLVPVEGGALVLGTWQGIYFCEFDGPRSRTVYVQPVGS
jgi:secondary thiamine-phosphate synthase enzyme